MFGYIVVNKPELKIKEFNEYRAYYCGLCRALKEKCGVRGQISLSYDMVFLTLLLTGLYEPEEEKYLQRCGIHPLEKQQMIRNTFTDYVADMTLLLAWYKCADDVMDEGKLSRAVYAKVLEKEVMAVRDRNFRCAEHIEESLAKLSELEQKKCEDIDELAGCFGRIMENIFAVREDEWEGSLRKIGFYMGKFIYILDAYDDVEKDRKKGCFNPFLNRIGDEGFDQWIKQLLIMVAVQFAGEFERLPVIKNVEILRNILYSGVWTRYEEIKNRRETRRNNS